MRWTALLSSSMQREIVRGTSYSLSFRILGICMSYLFTWYASRYIGLAAYGIFSVLFALLQVSGKFSRLGFDKSAMKFISEARSQKDGKEGGWYISALIPLLVATTITGWGFILFRSSISEVFFDTTDQSFAIGVLGALLPVVGVFNLNVWSLKGMKCIRSFSFFDNAGLFTLATLTLFSLVWLDLGWSNSLFFSVGISFGVLLIWSSVVWLRQISFEGILQDWKVRISPLFALGIPMLIAGSMFMLLSWTDTLILGVYSSDTEVGSYNIVMKIAKVLGIFFVALNGIYSPKISEYFVNSDMKGVEQMTVWSSRLIFWVTTPGFVIIVLFPEFLMSLFNSDMIQPQNVLALRILAIGMLVNALTGNVAPLLQLTGKQRIVQNLAIVTTGTNIALNFALIPFYGVVGAAISSAIALIIYNVLSIWFVWRSFGIHVNFIQRLWR